MGQISRCLGLAFLYFANSTVLWPRVQGSARPRRDEAMVLTGRMTTVDRCGSHNGGGCQWRVIMNWYSGRFVRAPAIAATGSLVALLSQGCGESFGGESPNASGIALSSLPAGVQGAARSEIGRSGSIDLARTSPNAPDVVADAGQRDELFIFFGSVSAPSKAFRISNTSLTKTCASSNNSDLGVSLVERKSRTGSGVGDRNN